MNLENHAKEQINKLKSLCNNNGIITDDIVTKDYNYEFNAISERHKVKVQVYFGKKGIKVILQGDQKNELYKSVNNLLFDQQSFNLTETTLKEPDEYIGTDECGKGDFFGPLVVGAVYVDKISKIKLGKIGVRDSKDLSDSQIKFLSRETKKIIGDNYSVIKINPEKYNEVYEKFGNLNKLLNWAHSKALINLFEKVDCNFVITDKFSNKDLDISFSSKHSNIEFIQEAKAEKYVGVAAASIIARDAFLNWYLNQKRSGINLPKGSSVETEIFAKNLLKKIGEKKLNELAKLHFKTYKKITSIQQN